ncbi:MAG: YraN family protein [Fimbriimonadales bacterium]|nr:YraN family protein [Fimbriimonadales bacterium]
MPGFRRIGDAAEQRAVDFLLENGYSIVKRNYKKGDSEIDIIAMDNEEIVFIEVRSRKQNAWETAEESITTSKQKRLWKTAEQFLADTENIDHPCRFDVIAINGENLTHYKDAFRPMP